MMSCSGFTKRLVKKLVRKKQFSSESVSDSKLNRCLNTLDLTLLGVGSTLGLGIYILAGDIASKHSGPAIIVSFLIAAVASVFSGLCYAEFGARVPRAGSAYVYSYVSVGEFMAFIIGWNLILEYVIGSASVARGYSNYIDYITGSKMTAYLTEHLPIDVKYLSKFPDFLSFAITIAISAMLAFGVSESAKLNNTFTVLNLMIVLYSVICGAFKAKLSNWQLTKDQIPSNAGSGGFMPFGFSEMMSGAASAFYGFVGFDCIATTGEEVKNPQRAIPISIIVSLFIVFLSYFGISAIQTLMWPYYDQNQKAPLPYVFEQVGWESAKWIITIGALFALSTSLLGAMFPLPRVLYAMANDGVIFRFLANIHPKYKTPIIATAVAGVFSGLMAMMFDVDQLIQMMSIGTLLAYSLVALSVLILRYSRRLDAMPLHSASISPSTSAFQGDKANPEGHLCGSVQISSSVMLSLQDYTRRDVMRQVYNLDKVQTPTQLSTRVSIALISVLGCLLAVFDAILVFLEDYLAEVRVLIPLSFVFILIVVAMVALFKQPQNPKEISFKVPFMPLTPMLSIFVNIYLMFKLSAFTWIRFGAWLFVGLLIYFFYGMEHSSENVRTSGTLDQADSMQCVSEVSPLVQQSKSPK